MWVGLLIHTMGSSELKSPSFWGEKKKIKTEGLLIYGSFTDQRQEMGQNAMRLAALITSVGVQGDDLSANAAF